MTDQFDFSNLNKLDITGKTSKCYLPDLDDDAYIEVLAADESNKMYYQAVMKMGAKVAQVKVRRGRIDPTILNDQREMDRVLFPKSVIRSWGSIHTATGESVEFSEPAVQALCDQLCKSAPRVFDELRAHANIPANFMDAEDLDIQPENLAGN